MPDDGQLLEGQGESGGSPYDSYLQSVPDEARDAAQQWFADTSKGLDQKLEEYAQYRQTWEPYEGVERLREYTPEQISELLDWHGQVTSDDAQFRAWLEIANKEAGITQEPQEEEGGLQEELTREEIAQMIAGNLAEANAPLQEAYEELRFERAADSAEADIRAEIAELEAEHNIPPLSEEQRAMIYDLGMNYGLDAEGNPEPNAGSWVRYGFERLKAMTNEAQAAFVSQKANQPQPAMTTGGIERGKAAKTFEEAAARHRERIAQTQQFG